MYKRGGKIQDRGREKISKKRFRKSVDRVGNSVVI